MKSSMINFTCPRCGKKFKRDVGSTVEITPCPECNEYAQRTEGGDDE